MLHDLSPQAQSVELNLGPQAAEKKAIDNLSGAAFIGESLYLANDEGRTLLHLRRDHLRHYKLLEAIEIADLFDIEDEIDGKSEFDLEALAVDHVEQDTVRLWLIGSHAMGHDEPEGTSLKRLGLKRERNRLLFACVATDKDGLIQDSGRHLRIKPAGQTYTTGFLSALRAAPPRASGFLREVSALTRRKIPKDVAAVGWFTPYTLASTKENGLDVEGLVVRRRDGDPSSVVAFVGLRGPVIDGFAVVVEVGIRDHNKRALKIAAGPRFHLLDLHGFGVRDLEWRGDDLLILAGPTMTRQGESALFRWNGAWNATTAGGEANAFEVGGIDHVGRLPMAPDGGGPEVITTIAPDTDEFMLLRDGIKGPRLVDHEGNASAEGPVYRAEVYRVANR